MKNIGGLMFFFGLGSIVLGMVGYEFQLMMWVDNWGPTIGWTIRVSLIVAGGLLWLMGNSMESGEIEQPDG